MLMSSNLAIKDEIYSLYIEFHEFISRFNFCLLIMISVEQNVKQ